ncbi:hypothetical protein EDD22DRAFT_1018981 [Suillus occidentalis]|nr:hypothetical protein EDD22DRAFT_1018981 [Suillus occidentalis]
MRVASFFKDEDAKFATKTSSSKNGRKVGHYINTNTRVIHITNTNAYHSSRMRSPQIQHPRQPLAQSLADGDSIRHHLPSPLSPLPLILLQPLPLLLPSPLPLHHNLPHHRVLLLPLHLSLPLPSRDSTPSIIIALIVHKISTRESNIKTIYARF